MGYALAMSAEIRAWLDELQASDPDSAAAVGRALIALAEAGPALRPPLVRPLPPAWSAGTDPREALDSAYSARLEQMHVVRRGVAEAANVRAAIEARVTELGQPGGEMNPDEAARAARELAELRALLPGLVRAERRLTESSQRRQANTELFSIRKESLKASYTAAEAERQIAELLAAADGDQHDELSAADAARRQADAEAQIAGLLAGETGPEPLLELRPAQPGEPGHDISLIFAVEPAGTALLISVVQGEDALRYEWSQAAEVAAGVLRQAMAGLDPGASAVRFADAAAFAASFGPAGQAGARAGTGPDPAATSAAQPPEEELSVPWLPFALTMQGHPGCEHRIVTDGLELTAGPQTDLFIDPAGAGQPPDAGRFLGTPPPGDFTLSARVTVDFGSRFDAGVLLVHADDQHWAKLCFELSPQLRPTAVTVVTRNTSDDCNSFEVTGDALWLRISRAGRAWAFHASTDGAWWRLLRYFELGTQAPVRVGFLAQSPAGPGCTARFGQISFTQGAPADLRDGS